MASAGHGSGDHLDDPADTGPDRLDVIWSFFGPRRPGDVGDMADHPICCQIRDLALP